MIAATCGPVIPTTQDCNVVIWSFGAPSRPEDSSPSTNPAANNCRSRAFIYPSEFGLAKSAPVPNPLGIVTRGAFCDDSPHGKQMAISNRASKDFIPGIVSRCGDRLPV